MAILCDLGGTHVRFASQDDRGAINDIVRLQARDYPDFPAALLAYATQAGVDAKTEIIMAATAEPSRPWPVDVGALRARGVTITEIFNDFEAGAWGVASLSGDQLEVLRPGPGKPGEPRIVLGPGTGLGLGYMRPLADGSWGVQKTHGGHMMATLATDEHILLAELIARDKGTGRTIIYEDFACGRNLPRLYRAVCAMLGEAAEESGRAEDILNLSSDAAAITWRVFHEMLGLFAHACVTTINAYDGIYLDGGMVQRLRERNMFDAVTFLRFMTQNPVDVVKTDIAQTPVWVVNDPSVAIHGLAALRRSGIIETLQGGSHDA